MKDFTDALFEDLDLDKEADFESPMIKALIKRINGALGSWGYVDFLDGTIDKNDIWKAVIDLDNDTIDDNEGIVDAAYSAQSAILSALTPEQKQYTSIEVYSPNALLISIRVLEVPDNTFTANDLDNYGKDPEVTKKLDELEPRLFRYAGDKRSKKVRIQNLKMAKDYENELVRLSKEGLLKGIIDLKFKDRDNYSFTAKPVKGSDFSCKIPPNTKEYNVEGKSYFLWQKDSDNKVMRNKYGKFIPLDFNTNKDTFIKRFNELVTSKSFGSLHTDTDYVLFVNKANGQIICIDINDFDNCWLAGTMTLNFYGK